MKAKIQVTAEEFVEAFAKSRSYADVVKVTGLTRAAVHTRATLYRKKGVQLKKMPRNTHAKLDVKKLNALIKQVERQQAGW